MKTLTHIAPPTLWGTRSVYIGKVEYQFDELDQVTSFALHNDISIISNELNQCIIKCRYYTRLESAKFHNSILSDCILLLKQYATAQNLPEILLFLENEVAPSLDALQLICAKETRNVIDQAKCLVVLFITKYKSNELN